MRTNEGHRRRVRERFMKEGLEHFEESHALELLLFYAIPRRDTKPVARRLLDRFGSFAKVLEADPEALRQVEGVGPETAAYLHLLIETSRYYTLSRDRALTRFHDLNDCGRYLVNFFVGKKKEEVYLLCLDGKSQLLGCVRLCEGSTDCVDISVREVTEIALDTNAASVILAHNHPDGAALPSESDVMTTKRIAGMLEMMGVKLLDHIVVNGGRFVSMAQTGHYDPGGPRVILG